MFDLSKAYLGVGILVIIGSIWVGVELYIHYRIKLGVQALEAKIALQNQNQAIQSKAIDTKRYTQATPKIEEKIITKYKIIKQKDPSCQAQMQEVKNALDIYFRGNNAM
ncbi:hypothetical protein BKH46_07430 [Helicobacter sp. 12S02634-8]|uniref:hypothetical protein n=1 Tax=Helicobacter sp. 12S02634-8 TaxID=1476199 RepID=UPI000BA7815D|nr:hypothetical protein [Helicobacter sp. 12S02634-8]PAF46412.1 hypothetical protein BKH46_07430 [Helicobacter sp. 12S02634-8]